MNKFLILVSGIAIGAGISWVYHKNKYEQLIEEEMDSVREHAKNYKKESVESENDKNDTQSDEEEAVEKDITDYHNVIKNNAYEYEPEKDIFVVTPQDFSSIPGYDVDSLYYHDNNVISNDDEEEVDNVEELLGMTALQVKEHFGEYEDDTVYIRNALLHTDYEVLKSLDDFEPRHSLK